MSKDLYVVYGVGADAVGLVERISTAIAEKGGNLTDLRQEAQHGLFAITLVADLKGTGLRREQFEELIRSIGEETGLNLHTANYLAAAGAAVSKNMLLILLGRDRPGIISRVSKDLSSHKINIESSRMMARGGIFLMELTTDIGQCTLPPENLETVVRDHMAAVGISAMFQTHDVFHPKKRVILFDLSGSFIPDPMLRELLEQSGLTPQDLPGSAAAAAGRLEGMPLEVLQQIVRNLSLPSDTLELIRSLKAMGYRTALSARAFSPVTDWIQQKLGLDHAFGVELESDDDSQTITGSPGSPALDTETVVGQLVAREGVNRQDVSVIHDSPDELPPGIRIDFNMRLVLDYLNQRVLSRETLAGVLGGFGTIRPNARG